jgi:hypothetical protein
MLHVISLGAGVQSTTMALMAAHGEITPMPDCAIFADTGWEPKAVYDHLQWLISQLPFPVHVVSAGNIRDHILNGSPRSGNFASVPWHVRKSNGEIGIGRRQCTAHYKVEPMRKKERELLDKPYPARVAAGAVEKWLGITVDEIFRVTPSKVKFEINRFPLIECRMSRGDCLEWLKRNSYPRPPKSACIGCPYHSNEQWRDMKINHPDEWDDAVMVDRKIRTNVWKKFDGEQFMHSSNRPLDKADLTTLEDHGQLNLFNNECEGMCGV